jgi:hypothetical protein
MKNFVTQHLEKASLPAARELDTKKIGDVVQAELKKALSAELNALSKRMDDERRASNAASTAKQEAILRLVSSTLTENVEGVIRKMVQDNMREILLPRMQETTSTALQQSVANNLKSALAVPLTKELPALVSQTLDSVSGKMSKVVANEVVGAIQPIIRSSNTAIADAIEEKFNGQLRQTHAQREADALKISQLTDAVNALTETIESMAMGQAELQGQLSTLLQRLDSGAGSTAQNTPQTPIIQRTPEQMEAEAINQLMADGLYQEAAIKWFRSPSPTRVFDEIIVKCNPACLGQVSQLLNLTACTVISENLERNTAARLVWLDTVLKNLDPHVSLYTYGLACSRLIVKIAPRDPRYDPEDHGCDARAFHGCVYPTQRGITWQSTSPSHCTIDQPGEGHSCHPY